MDWDFERLIGHRPSTYFSLAGEGSNLQPPDPKSGVLPVELPAKVASGFRRAVPSALDELDAIAEWVVDVAATDFRHLVVESYLVTCRTQRPAQLIQVLD